MSWKHTKPISFYCNCHPARISPSRQVQAIGTLIPIQMDLQGSSFEKRRKMSPTSQSCSPVCIPWKGGEGLSAYIEAASSFLTWLSLVGKKKRDPSLPPPRGPPPRALINTDYFSPPHSCPVNCPARVKGWEPRLERRAQISGIKLFSPSSTTRLSREGESPLLPLPSPLLPSLSSLPSHGPHSSFTTSTFPYIWKYKN